MADWRSELLQRLTDVSGSYSRAARRQEIAYWVGSALAAICSAVASLSVAADLSGWRPPCGKVITAVLAIIPAVWTAAERSLHLRGVSLFNYTVASELEALAVEVQYTTDIDAKTAAKRYADIIRRENTNFIDLMSSVGHDCRQPPQRSQEQQP